MHPHRRDVLKYAGVMSAAAAGMFSARRVLAEPHGSEHTATLSPDTRAVLVDLTECIGCRLCEYACKKTNSIDPGPLASYDDTTVFTEMRRPAPDAFTVVNRHTPTDAQSPVYTKVNCLHCNKASCVSACIVGALSKEPSGAVSYDAWKCIGCRYCMVACPFQIPTYEYDHVLTPQVRKCTLCEDRTSKGERPACVKECPREAMVYGKRDELLALAKRRIQEHPDRYINHVYGEHEVGGTSWLYLSAVPFEQAGFLRLGNAAPPVLTETIQHGVFKHWIAPISLYSFFSAASWFTARRNKLAAEKQANSPTMHRALAGAASRGERHNLLEEHTLAAQHRNEGHHASSHASSAAPVQRKLLTPGVWVLIAMVAIGAGFGLYRFLFGLGAATNLDQQHPWGLWIAMDVGSGIALAGGGFVTAALVHIFHREHYHAIARSALLTALLGYTFYVPGLLADLGRWYNLWHTMLPDMWQGNSVLFEVGMCVMIYLNVQYAELMPIFCERIVGEKKRFPRLASLAQTVHGTLERIMPALLILGVTLSMFHQSSLGNLLVIAPYKLHPLWWSPIAPIHFLLSAMMVGFPMVIFTMLFGGWCLKRKAPMNVLTPLSRYVLVFLFAYLGTKVGDMVVRGTWTYLTTPSLQSVAWLIEMIGGVLVPLVMLLTPAVRRSPGKLAAACLMIILGVVINRLDVFIIGYHPPYAAKSYVPSLTEFALSFGLVAGLMLAYRIAVTYLPILEPAPASTPAPALAPVPEEAAL
jgi:Ni/Fe-hydrogenase subunit HybB-like protein/Fe-S-cluster-containing dehydrogenase component